MASFNNRSRVDIATYPMGSLTYMNPMRLALVYSRNSVYKPYGTYTSLYCKYSYIDPMGQVLTEHP